MESSAPPSLAQIFPILYFPILILVFPPKLRCWRGTPVHSRGIRGSPNLPCQVFCAFPAFACSSQGLSRIFCVSQLPAVAARLFWAGSGAGRLKFQLYPMGCQQCFVQAGSSSGTLGWTRGTLIPAGRTRKTPELPAKPWEQRQPRGLWGRVEFPALELWEGRDWGSRGAAPAQSPWGC